MFTIKYLNNFESMCIVSFIINQSNNMNLGLVNNLGPLNDCFRCFILIHPTELKIENHWH